MTFFCPYCNHKARLKFRNPKSDLICEGPAHHVFPQSRAKTEAQVVPVFPQDPPADSLNYRNLRLGLRNALYRVFGTNIPDVSELYRAIEAGMTAGEASDQFEHLFRHLTKQEA